MTSLKQNGLKPSYQKSYIQLESIADKAEAARIANGTVKEHQQKRVTDDAVERMAKSDKAHLRVTDYDRMRELYEQGMTDGKIAREMGLVDQSLVRKWRDRYGIPAHGNQKRVPKFNPDLALQMYKDGSSDRQIAEAMDVDRSQVYQWRKKEGLQAVSKMNDKLKQEMYEYKEPEQIAPVVDDLEPDMDEVTNETVATVKELPVPVVKKAETVINPIEKEFMETATIEMDVNSFCQMLNRRPTPPVIDADFDSIIEEKNAIIQDLLVKNAELAGFIDGIKFAKGWMAG